METIDFSAGALIPFYDHDTRTVYLAGKVTNRMEHLFALKLMFFQGDGNIRYYEVSDQGEPFLYFLSEYKSSAPQRCLGKLTSINCSKSNCSSSC